MVSTDIDWDAAAEKARRLYHDKIRPILTEADIGKYVVFDVLSWDYQIDDMSIDAALKLKQRKPGARMWFMRVGFSAAVFIGWHEEPKL